MIWKSKDIMLLLQKINNAFRLVIRYKKIVKVRVYFCRESDIEITLKTNKISRQALDTLYELVWESEFKNILIAGRFWARFREDEEPFGLPLKEKRSHNKISPGDLIQIADEFYKVDQIGVEKIKIAD
jgi:hypothetical protein